MFLVAGCCCSQPLPDERGSSDLEMNDMGGTDDAADDASLNPARKDLMKRE